MEVNGLKLDKCTDVKLLRKAISELFEIIDDIDTASDIFKPECTPYSKYVMNESLKRGTVVFSDGYDLFVRDQTT